MKNEAKSMETVEKEELESLPMRGGEARRRKVPRRGAL
ncbi:hypothetical protein C5S35_05785 [Candidatus Methanophagaceae archaeon]|jgi:hypothetical protein|nr:hypothetical protein C5S35_05785 [Methanophagales archaeon]